MKEIPLTRGYVALVDDEDFPDLSGKKWKADVRIRSDGSKRVWAAREKYNAGAVSTELMHRVIVDAPKGLEVDHVNGDSLDNRRTNLRLVTTMQNSRNQRTQGTYKGKTKSSKFKGVSFDKGSGQWSASICVGRRLKWLGRHESQEGAALAYNAAAVSLFGEHARLNKVEV